MKINFYFILTVLCTSTCLHASQVVHKEVAEGQHHATRLELRMIDDAKWGRLTEKKLQRYLKKGAYVNAKNYVGITALILESGLGHAATVQQLIAAGANVNAKANDGYTALILASCHGRTAVVQLLIAAHADINAKTNFGNNVLMLASSGGHTAIVQLLIAAGADRTIVCENDNYQTARDYAQDEDDYDEAVAAGLAEWHKKQAEYRLRQSRAKQIIEEQQSLIPAISNIIAKYAYGPSPMDLPPTKSQEEEKKSDSAQAVLETSKNKKEKKSNCAVQCAVQ